MTHQELLWKYAEGVCNLNEIAQVEKLLTEDPSLQTELNGMLEVQSLLVGMEAEGPSMRFTQNVLDALPNIYPSEVTEPLVKPVWKKVFWMAVAAIMTGLFLMPRSTSPTGDLLSTYIENLLDSAGQVVGQVPYLVLQYFLLTLFSVALLMLVDRMFLKKAKGLFMI